MSDFLRTHKVKVRKFHRCDSCDAAIRKGDIATLYVVVDNGRPWNIYACPGCEALFIKYPKELFCHGEQIEGALVELLEENEEAKLVYVEARKAAREENNVNT